MYSVAIVDNVQILSEGLKELLQKYADIQSVEAYDSGESFIYTVSNTESYPDVALLDIRMPGMNGIEICEWLTRNDIPTRVIMLSSHHSEVYVENAFYHGAKGYVLKKSGSEEVYRAIIEVMENGYYLNELIPLYLVRKLLKSNYIMPKERRYPKLTEREKEIMILICQEKSIQEISQVLDISNKTVDTTIQRLKKKLNVKKSIGLAVFAMQESLVE